MTLKQELEAQKQRLTRILKQLNSSDPEYAKTWDERVDIIYKIKEIEERENGKRT